MTRAAVEVYAGDHSHSLNAVLLMIATLMMDLLEVKILVKKLV